MIPPITDSLGKHWTQPAINEIVLDETHALMSRSAFDRLAEYSSTMPSGVYDGKMWKRHDGAHDRVFIARGGKPAWQLLWFEPCADPKLCAINRREILLVEGALP